MTLAIPDLTVGVVEHPEDVGRFWSWLTGAGQGREMVAVDTETTGLEWWVSGFRVRLVQFGDTGGGWAVPMDGYGGVARAALEWCYAHAVRVVFHNVAFDALALMVAGMPLDWSVVEDTMIYAHLGNHAEQFVGLKECGHREFGSWATVGERMLARGMKEQGWTWETVPMGWQPYPMYAVIDTCLTAGLWERWADRRARYGHLHDLEIAAIRVATQMVWNGIAIDGDYLAATARDYEFREDDIRQKLQSIGITNPSQNAQVADLLRRDGVVLPKTESGKDSVAAGVLRLTGHPVAQAVLDWRELHKIRVTYLEGLMRSAGYVAGRGVVHPEIRTMAARTGRMSIANPPMQQLPRDNLSVRDGIIAREDDHVLVTADYSQIEMRLFAGLTKDTAMQAVFREADKTGSDFFVEVGRDVYADPSFTKKDLRRTLIKSCVPLDHQIWTKRGWLTYDEVKAGDETYGYDHQTGRSRWTTVTGVSVYPDPAEVYQIGNRQRSFVCTPDHRWVTSTGFVRAEDVNTHTQIVLAAPAVDGDLDITADEAALLGWIFGDGHIKRQKATGATAQGKGGWRIGLSVVITQIKPHRRIEIADLLVRLGVRWTATGDQFVLDRAYCRSLLARARIGDSKQDFDPWLLASGLTRKARAAMAATIEAADGKGGRRYAVVQQADTSVARLVVALGFLLGRFSRITTYHPDGKNWQRKPIQVIEHQRAGLTGQKFQMNRAPDEPVWCVSTDLGSWTMRGPDGTPVLTGNTMYGAIYTAGIETMAATAGVTVEAMTPVRRALSDRYPSLRTLGTELIHCTNDATGTRAWWTRTPFGRVMSTTKRQESRVLVNYLVQGHAAEILKTALVRLDAAGLGPLMCLPIHDELVCSVPKRDAEEIRHLIGEVMSGVVDEEQMGVGVPAEPSAAISKLGDAKR